jgi:hypothetical protein
MMLYLNGSESDEESIDEESIDETAENRINDAEIVRMLMRDFVSRKTRSFEVRTIELNAKPRLVVDLPYMIIGKRRGLPSYGDFHRSKLLLASFPLLRIILKPACCRFILAGGAVAKSLWVKGFDKLTCDADLFFISEDPNIDATSVLRSTIAQMRVEDPSLICTRNRNTVTIYSNGAKYQFVLRVYPSIGHVLGGFDIQAAAVAFDGDSYIATEFGEWSCINRIIIADTMRRSTSYEYRLQKYNKWCSILFPGISTKAVYDKAVAARKNFYDAHEQCCAEYGVNFVRVDNRFGFKYASKGYSDQAAEVQAFADAHNVKITIDYSGHSVNRNIKKQLKNDVSKLAYEHNFEWRGREFIGESKIRNTHFTICARLYTDSDSPRAYYEFSTKSITVSDYADTSYGSDPVAYLATVNTSLVRSGNTEYIWYIGSDLDDMSIAVNRILLADHLIYAVNCNMIKWGMPVLNEPGIQPNYYIRTRLRGRLRYSSLVKPTKTVFQEYYPEVCRLLRQKVAMDTVYDVVARIREFQDILYARLQATMCAIGVKPIEWIHENPGRQWTSSLNPIMEHPQKWYENMYTPFHLLSPEYQLRYQTERELWRLRLRQPFARLPRDLLIHIIRLVVTF